MTADWNLFKSMFGNMDIFIPKMISQEKLDEMTTKLHKYIDIALDKVCPVTKPKIIKKNLKDRSTAKTLRRNIHLI